MDERDNRRMDIEFGQIDKEREKKQKKGNKWVNEREPARRCKKSDFSVFGCLIGEKELDSIWTQIFIEKETYTPCSRLVFPESIREHTNL